MRNLALLITLLLLTNTVIDAQPKNQFVKSGEVIKAAYHFCDSSWYPRAIDTLLTIDKSDTAYSLVLTELAYCNMNAKKYPEALQFANKALGYTSPYKLRLALIKGNTYDSWGYPDSAISLYQKSLEKYPYNYLIYYNLGITNTNQKKYKEAVSAFQKAILYNPFYGSSYIALGRIMARMGQYVHAMLCLETYLTIDPNGTRSNYNLVFLNNMLSNALDSEYTPIDPSVDNKEFDETDQLIKSGIALNSGFKVKVKFDAPVAKQTQLLFESLRYKPNTGDFWMDFLVPMFLKVKDAGFVEEYIYTIATSAPNKDIAGQLKKRQSNIKEMNGILGGSLGTLYQKQKINMGGQVQEMDLHLDENNNVVSYGNFAGDHKTRIGYWKFFHPNGEEKAEGNYAEGKPDGKWVYHDEKGLISYVETYSKGKMDGDYIGYYPNGTLMTEYVYKDNKIQGKGFDYYRNGKPSFIGEYTNNIRNGQYTTFYGCTTKFHFMQHFDNL